MKKAAEYFLYMIVVLLMAAGVVTYLAPHFGWRVDAVISGSMEPTLKTGSLVVTRPIDPGSIEVGDVITFRPVSVGDIMITHRVIGMEKNSPISFYTKGDANNTPDPFRVPTRNLVGKICVHIPYCGYFTEFLKTPVGFVSAIVIPSIILFVMYIFCVLRLVTENKKRRANS